MNRFVLMVAAATLFAACGQPTETANSGNAEAPAEEAAASAAIGISLSPQIIYDVAIRTSPDEEETDWRLTNVKEGHLNQFLADVFASVRAGKLAAYAHPLGVPTRDEQYKISPEAFDAFCTDTVVFWVEDPASGEMVETPTATQTTHEEVFSLEFVEDWQYDPATLLMTKTVTGFCCMVPVFSLETGLFKGNKKLFWVWFDDEPLLDYPA